MVRRSCVFSVLTSALLPALVVAGEAIPNRLAPASWSPAKSRGGLAVMDVTNPLPFIGLAPCRIVDTRGNGAPIQGGIFTGGSDVRSYALAGICGIPASARAVSLNLTVTGPGQTTAEGPEAGTYFRGRGRFQQGLATIEPPEDFRMITDPASLSIRVTPIGEVTGVAVARIGLDQIVVKGSRDVEFFYMVNGVRRAYNRRDPIQENENFFVPESSTAKLPKYLSEEERGRLIANGTYNPDGAVNMETAERWGWAKVWRDREERTKEAAESACQTTAGQKK